MLQAALKIVPHTMYAWERNYTNAIGITHVLDV